MIPKYNITAIRIGSEFGDKSTLTLGRNFGVQVEIPFWIAAIEGNGHRLLVDSGIANWEWVNTNVAPCKQKDNEHIEIALQQLGWDLDTVEAVINTHLHYDHCGGNTMFTTARFYISQTEWEYAKNPILTQSVFYDGSYKSKDIDYFSYYFTVDHFEVFPGIRILMTPGHTPGHQSVLVNTNEGIVAITGDAIGLIENLNEGSPPGILHDTTAAIRSIMRIKEFADLILPSHDLCIENFQNKNFPTTK